MSKNEIIKIVQNFDNYERVDELGSDITYDTVKHTVSKLKKVLYDNPDIAAVCAPQIGDNLRLFVVKLARSEKDRFKVFLNPLIVSHEGMHLSREINLSFPNKQFIIPRFNKVHIAYQEIDGKANSETYIGPYSEIVQQMIEMLDGITLDTYGLDLDDVGGPEEFDKASNKDKTELMSLYLSSIKDISNNLKTDINDDPKLKFIDDNIEFMTKVLKGEVEIIPESKKENKEV